MQQEDVKAAPHAWEALTSCLQQLNFAFTIADCSLADTPLVFASEAFYQLTGFSPGEVLGKNCRFLQGSATSRAKVAEMRDAMREERSCQVCLLNYRKDGTTFWNQLLLAPVCDADGRTMQCIGIQVDVTHLVEGRAAWPTMRSRSGLSDAPQLNSNQEGCLDIASAELRSAQHLHVTLRKWDSCNARSSGELLRRSSSAGSRASLSSPRLPASLLAPLLRLQQAYVLADARQDDCPIVHASAAFLELTGYPEEEVLGRNCRFLQGPATDGGEVQRLRSALAADPPHPVTVKLLNYRYDGTPFWNSLHVAPVRSAAGQVVFFVGVQLDISRPEANQAEHRTSTFQAAPSPLGKTTGDAAAAEAHVQPAVPACLSREGSLVRRQLSGTLNLAPASRAGQAAAAAREALLVQQHGEAAGAGQAAGQGQPLQPAKRQAACALPMCGEVDPRARVSQKGVVGAVRVACRSLCPEAGLRRSEDHQFLPGTPQSAPGAHHRIFREFRQTI